MASCPTVDAAKTLAELTGEDWGPPLPDDRLAVRERKVARRKRLADWTHRELVRFLCIGVDQQILVPAALQRLADDPVASGCDWEGELLCAVLESDGFDWRGHPECVRLVRDSVAAALNEIAQTTDDLARLRAEWHVYQSLAVFERRLSAVP